MNASSDARETATLDLFSVAIILLSMLINQNGHFGHPTFKSLLKARSCVMQFWKRCLLAVLSTNHCTIAQV